MHSLLVGSMSISRVFFVSAFDDNLYRYGMVIDWDEINERN